ncbi:hypothetical protein K0U07_02975 [bacterium]|nr:hypothetical protein [bacterium]
MDHSEIDIFVLTGELSGDKLGYELLKGLDTVYQIEGAIGPNLSTLNIKKAFSMNCFSVMGFSKIISSLFGIIRSFVKMRNYILKKNPKMVLLIDLPDINLRMAKHLRKKGYKGKIVQVVCPSIWAWRPKRKKTLEKYYDHLLCLFPFEKELFKDSTLPVTCIGHPLSKIVPRNSDPKKNILAIFPGSRKHEVEKLLPSYLKAVEPLTDFAIHISIAKESLRPVIEKITRGKKVILRAPREKEALINEASFALTKNGTINLELALSHLPQVSSYRITPLETIIMKAFPSLYLPHYSLPNILLKKRIIPELVGPFASTKNLAYEIKNLVENPFVLESMESDYKKLSSLLKKFSINDPQETLTSIMD